ncbi:MAG: methylmalonyl-CoA mutase [Planctomycetota bacterium]|nr:MAG: methylmalonyl-CoA mutase [Planctomycetota bacterium]
MRDGRSTGEQRRNLDSERAEAALPGGRVATASGLPLQPVYVPGDAPAPADGPGQYPFTRGIHPQMYRGRLWTMRQYAGYSSAAETNRRFRYLLDQGQTGLSVAFDLPTQIGYDSDHVLARAEAGKVGVAINSLRDLERLFDGIPLGRVSTSMTINATALILFSMYVVLCRRQGVAPAAILGTVQNDILKEFIARGNYRFDVAPAMRLTTDLFQLQQDVAPNFHPISVSGYHMREAGCTAVQEVAYALGDGLAYLEAARAAGLDLAATARSLSFFFAAHNELFEEVAKFRAARRVWARLVRERLGVADPRAQMLRFHTQTAGSALTADQPEVNAVRVTLQALAAVLGGTQSLHTNSYDEALGLPTERTARLALRTQQVLAYESGAAAVADPLGGSPFLEKLTLDLEEAVVAEMRRIDSDYGGMLGAVRAGYVQRQIHREALRHQREVESGERVVVGVNRFRVDGAPRAEVFRPDPQAREHIFAALDDLRRRRDGRALLRALDRVSAAAADPAAPLGPPVLAAVEADATVGEISAALSAVFAPYQAPSAF